MCENISSAEGSTELPQGTIVIGSGTTIVSWNYYNLKIYGKLVIGSKKP